ncbi:MAG: BLUF domain-containing protein [Bacteroidota bacterium]|nr:BLUF domain-containing protein [Bacteroidota bacterium]
MKQLAYVSSAVRLMNGEELLEILKTARKNNSERDVTGVLLYSEGTFIQAIEGEGDDVDSIFTAIELDARHKNIIKLIDNTIEKRFFPDWTMGFANIDMDRAREITGFLSSTGDLVNSDNKNTLATVLRTFIATNNLVIEN